MNINTVLKDEEIRQEGIKDSFLKDYLGMSDNQAEEIIKHLENNESPLITKEDSKLYKDNSLASINDFEIPYPLQVKATLYHSSEKEKENEYLFEVGFYTKEEDNFELYDNILINLMCENNEIKEYWIYLDDVWEYTHWETIEHI
ncbi:MAG: hypothetical protein ACLTDM_18795 [Clostridium butyricum]